MIYDVDVDIFFTVWYYSGSGARNINLRSALFRFNHLHVGGCTAEECGVANDK